VSVENLQLLACPTSNSGASL